MPNSLLNWIDNVILKSVLKHIDRLQDIMEALMVKGGFGGSYGGTKL